MVRRLLLSAVCLSMAGVTATSADAQRRLTDKGVYLCNSARTGYTPDALRPPYQPAWVYSARHKPRPAWREPAWETQRIDFDYAFAATVGGGMVYFGSSADHAVRALDLETGAERWAFFTEGPLRLAPAVHGGRVYASSDDGFVYCLDGRSGKLLWKFRPPVPDRRLIGNEQMISRWPARSGVLIDGGRAYTTFGMLSPEGIFVYCLDAETGSVIWRNDTSGTRYMTCPHFEAMGGVSPQGYLALCGDVLVVPCGRATPAFFNAQTGKLLYHESEGLFPGGAWTMSYRDLAFTPCETLRKPNPVEPEAAEANIAEDACLVAVRARTGEEVFHLQGGLQGVISDDGMLTLIGRDKLTRLRLADVISAGVQQTIRNSEGHFVSAVEHKQWEMPSERIYTLLQAGETLIAGGRGSLGCFDAQTGRPIWETKVEGDVQALAAAAGSLLAGTTEGKIYCFRPGQGGKAATTSPDSQALEIPAAERRRAAEFLAAGGVSQGYCLVLGEASVPFLAALAEQSSLTIHHPVGEKDADDDRRKLDAAGLYGTRIAIHNASQRRLPYADFSANLVLLEAPPAERLEETPAAEVYRVLRPCGGVALVAFVDSLGPSVQKWLEAGGVPRDQWERIPGGVKITRGRLPGAGEWTHQYADPGKSSASAERHARLPLEVLWFGGVGPAGVVSRHYRTPAPLVIEGRCFVPGIRDLIAMDAYNGRILWQRDLPGVGHWPAAWRGGSIAADREAVYALQGTKCLRLDAETGETLQVYDVPEPPARDPQESATAAELIWEYLAVTADFVVGSLGAPNIEMSWWSRAHPANRCVFVLDKATGSPIWRYLASQAVDSSAIAIADGQLFLIDGLPLLWPADRKGQSKPAAPAARLLKAFDLASGRLLWQTDAVGAGQSSLWVQDGVLLSTITPDGTVRSRTKPLSWQGPDVSAFSTRDGSMLWELDQIGRCSPVIIDGTVYFPEAFDLRTGERVEAEDPLTGEPVPFEPRFGLGCGKYAGCPTLMTMRSGSLGFYDLSGKSGLYNGPNVRASCWINMIPAGGLVVVPEGSSSCPCAYNYKTSLALAPASRHNEWGIYGRAGAAEKDGLIRRLRINFAAPGDRPDSGGNVWFAFPRPSTVGPRGAGGMGAPPSAALPLEIVGAEPEQFAFNPDWTAVAATETPWLHSCGWMGPLRLDCQLAPDDQARRTYRVVLLFNEPELPPAPRVFDVKLQGRTVLAGLDVLAEAGRPNKALAKEFTVEAGRTLTLELVGRQDNAPPPIISGIEIVAVGNRDP